MTLVSPPDSITAFRDMMLACSSVTGAGLTTGKIWYPSAVAESDDATAVDALPRAILAEEDYTRSRYAEGARGLPGGRISCTVSAAVATGVLEALARSIIDDMELLSHSQGLPNLKGSTGLASEPTPGQRAAADGSTHTDAEFSTISMTFDYGLNA